MGAPILEPARPSGGAVASAESVRQRVAAQLDASMQTRLRRLLWLDRLTSLWAPVTLFGLLFTLYLFIVELHTPSYEWAQPVLKAWGLVALVAFFALWAARYVFRKPFELRRLRTAARELQDELVEMGDRAGARMEPKLREQIVARTVQVHQAVVSEDAARLETELQGYSDLAEKQLGSFRRNGAAYFVSGLVKALLIALVIRGVLIEPFKIPSGSMIPTLAIGDQIFVNKFIYGVRIPFVNKVPFQLVREPERGDVIVFNNPLDESKDFIKRVIGIPGDEIEIREEVIYINGEPQPRRLLDPEYVYDHRGEGMPWVEVRGALYQEKIGDQAHRTIQTPGITSEDNFPRFTVPPKSVFVMGDNREQSADSRMAFGVPGQSEDLTFVPYGHIKGKAMVIWLSLSRNGLFSRFFDGTGIRTDRFFLPVR